ncbi:MAG: insulinase family protein [Treponema sp.]|nr:insulinase family protein [Treponema sp.]
MKFYKRFFCILFFLSLCTLVFAKKTPLKNVSRFTLKNGLTLFVIEDHSVPLVHIEIAIKTGAASQSKETAGLFHLYEHMMFKGNAKYKDAASVQRALTDMGVSDWNGTTGAECVNYFFTVPSNLLYEGLEFWSYAIRTPLIDEKELENEKKVVLSEIEGALSAPSTIYRYNLQKMIFKKFPWKLDPSGNPSVVKNATVSDIKKIQSEFYIPNNAALFVAGDVSPEKTFALAEKLYGEWQSGTDPWHNVAELHEAHPFDEVTFCVMPYEQIAKDIAQITITYRGPDTITDERATYTADVFGYLLSDPKGIYVHTLTQNHSLGVLGKDYIWESYLTTKMSSTISFGAIVSSSGCNVSEKANIFYRELSQNVFSKIVTGKDVFKSEQFKKVLQKVKDNYIEDSETSLRLKDNLRFWWICASDEYYYNYIKNMSKVNENDINAFLQKYIINAKPLVTVLLHPEIYEAQKSFFQENNFFVMSSDTAFWYARE